MNDVRKVAIDVIEKFRAAKAWVASDSYDGIDARGRELLEDADSSAKQFLASLPASGEAWYPSVWQVENATGLNPAQWVKYPHKVIRATADLIRDRGGQVGGAWNWIGQTSDERVLRMMTSVGMPDSVSLFQAFKQMENEIAQGIARQPGDQAAVKESVNG